MKKRKYMKSLLAGAAETLLPVSVFKEGETHIQTDNCKRRASVKAYKVIYV